MTSGDKRGGALVIFEDDDLRVVFHERSPKRVWITFGMFGSGPFGRAYVESRGESAVHLEPKRPHWYQVGRIEEAIARIAEVTASAQRIVCYGASMGGMAAIHFAPKLRAQLVIAVAPQVSIHPEIIGTFDTRWPDAVPLEAFVFQDIRSNDLSGIDLYLVYDPAHREDRAHAEMIAAHHKSRRVELPFAGHGVVQTLIETNSVRGLIDSIVSKKTGALKAVKADYRRTLKSTSAYWIGFGYRLDRSGRPRRAVEAFSQAILLNPRSIEAWLGMSASLWHADHKAVAIEADWRLIQLEPNHVEHRVQCGLRMIMVDRIDDAHALFTSSLADFGDKGLLLNGLSICERRLGRPEKALELLSRAIAVHPFITEWGGDIKAIAEEVRVKYFG